MIVKDISGNIIDEPPLLEGIFLIIIIIIIINN